MFLTQRYIRCLTSMLIFPVTHADHTGGWQCLTLGVRMIYPARTVQAELPNPNQSSCAPFNEHGPVPLCPPNVRGFARVEREGAWDVTLLETCEGQERGSL